MNATERRGSGNNVALEIGPQHVVVHHLDDIDRRAIQSYLFYD